MRTLLSILTLALLVQHASAQRAVASAGGDATGAGGTVSFTVGQVDYATASGSGGTAELGVQHVPVIRLRANISAFLQGPYDANSGLMNDGLRSGGYIPLTEPYTALGYTAMPAGGERIQASVLNATGNNAIVDWVHVELLHYEELNTMATRNGLLQRDGDIVDLDGVSPLRFNAAPGNYFVSVQHRNHLHMMSLLVVSLSASPTPIDFTDGSTATGGTDAQASISGTYAMWCGDVTGNGQVKYTGTGNDRDPVLVEVGGTVPTNTTTGYKMADVTMDGTVKYTGTGNDRDPILVVVGGTVPTNTRDAQMP